MIRKEYYIKTLNQMKKELCELGTHIQEDLSIYAWEEYYPRFRKLVDDIEILKKSISSKKK